MQGGERPEAGEDGPRWWSPGNAKTERRVMMGFPTMVGKSDERSSTRILSGEGWSAEVLGSGACIDTARRIWAECAGNSGRFPDGQAPTPKNEAPGSPAATTPGPRCLRIPAPRSRPANGYSAASKRCSDRFPVRSAQWKRREAECVRNTLPVTFRIRSRRHWDTGLVHASLGQIKNQAIDTSSSARKTQIGRPNDESTTRYFEQHLFRRIRRIGWDAGGGIPRWEDLSIL